MEKKTWMYVGAGVLGLALYFAYKKRNVPPPPQDGSKDTPVEGKTSGSLDMNMQFAAMNGQSYILPKKLIPNAYGQTGGYLFQNADGQPCETTNIQTACGCASKKTVPPTMLTNFK
jgi:hypothetical protein